MTKSSDHPGSFDTLVDFLKGTSSCTSGICEAVGLGICVGMVCVLGWMKAGSTGLL